MKKGINEERKKRMKKWRKDELKQQRNEKRKKQQKKEEETKSQWEKAWHVHGFQLMNPTNTMGIFSCPGEKAKELKSWLSTAWLVSISMIGWGQSTTGSPYRSYIYIYIYIYINIYVSFYLSISESIYLPTYKSDMSIISMSTEGSCIVFWFLMQQIKSSFKIYTRYTLPETNVFAPENGWKFARWGLPFGKTLFSEANC